MSSVREYCLVNRRIIFLLFIAYFGLPHFVFSADYNPFTENVEKLRIRAKAGDTEAQFMLGKFYYYGFCVERNYKEAIKWFRAAAIQGHAAAQAGAPAIAGSSAARARRASRPLCVSCLWWTLAQAGRGCHRNAGARSSGMEGHPARP